MEALIQQPLVLWGFLVLFIGLPGLTLLTSMSFDEDESQINSGRFERANLKKAA